MTGRYFFSVILLICVATTAAQDEDLCRYTLITKTGIQAANATTGARVDLIFYNPIIIPNPHVIITNISRYSVLGTHHESFQNDTLDVFFFDGPCDHYCDVALAFHGSKANSWHVQFFILQASLPTTPCDFTRRYPAHTTLHPYDAYDFNFCRREAVGTEKQKLAGASLLRLVGMPSYTT